MLPWEQLHVLFLGQTFTYNGETHAKKVNEKLTHYMYNVTTYLLYPTYTIENHKVKL